MVGWAACACRWVTQSLLRLSCCSSASSRTPCCKPSAPSPIFSVLGCSCCFVPCPAAATSFAPSHDEAVRGCLSDLLGAPPLLDTSAAAARVAQLLFHVGGLGLRSAASLAPTAFWGSWADVLPLLHSHLPDLAAAVLRSLRAPGPAPPRSCHALVGGAAAA